MMRLFIVRHGETVENAARIVNGQHEGLLSPRGREQAQAMANGLRGEQIDRIYSSDLGRAVETAAFLRDAVGAGILTETRLREQHFGDYEGRPLTALLRHMIRTGEDFAGLNPPGGERSEMFLGRIQDFWGEIRTRHEGDSIAMVTHHGVIAVLLASLLGKDVQGLESDLLTHGMILLAEVDAGDTLSLRYSMAEDRPPRWNVAWERTTA